MQEPDGVLPFYLTGSPQSSTAVISGRLARLSGPVSSILSRHAWPDAVNEVAAEAMALASCLSSQMKFEGVFTLQAKGDGPLKTLFADVTHAGDLRSYAAFDEQAVADIPCSAPAVLPRLMGSGYMAFTIDQQSAARPDGQRYQGIVELDGPHLGDAAHLWFKNSEQLASVFLTAAAPSETGWRAAAIMLQSIAASGGTGQTQQDSLDIWHDAVSFFSSVKRAELLDADLSSEQLIWRLFHLLGPHIQPLRPIQDKCRCSADKVEGMLRGLAEAERRELADEQGQLVVECEFCKTTRSYSQDQLAAL